MIFGLNYQVLPHQLWTPTPKIIDSQEARRGSGEASTTDPERAEIRYYPRLLATIWRGPPNTIPE